MKIDETMEPECASAKVRQKRPNSSLLRVISHKREHPGRALRIKRWHKYKEGMSVHYCWETAGLDHRDLGFYEKHGLMTLRPMTQEERQEALRPWDGNKPTRSRTAANHSHARDVRRPVVAELTTRHSTGRMPASFDRFAELVPSELLAHSGEVFYSGRAAFSRRSEGVYLLGYNPGSDPSDSRLRTVKSSIDEACGRAEHFSLYYEPWEDGRREQMQQGIWHLFERTELDPYLTPSSNCVFVRSRGTQELSDRRRLEAACWKFHEAVISELGIRLIVCLGADALTVVCKRVPTVRQVDEHVEANRRRWRSRAFETASGLVVVGLTHPSRVAWRKPPSDPCALVRRMLDRVRG